MTKVLSSLSIVLHVIVGKCLYSNLILIPFLVATLHGILNWAACLSASFWRTLTGGFFKKQIYGIIMKSSHSHPISLFNWFNQCNDKKAFSFLTSFLVKLWNNGFFLLLLLIDKSDSWQRRDKTVPPFPPSFLLTIGRCPLG